MGNGKFHVRLGIPEKMITIEAYSLMIFICANVIESDKSTHMEMFPMLQAYNVSSVWMKNFKLHASHNTNTLSHAPIIMMMKSYIDY